MLMKICNHCGKKIPQGKTCSCRYNSYDKSSRDKSKEKFYHSANWIKTAKKVKDRANGLDEYALNYEHRIVKGNIAHHIYELNDRPELKLSLDNLIYVSSQTHNKIHSIYAKSLSEKLSMQKKLWAIHNRR